MPSRDRAIRLVIAAAVLIALPASAAPAPDSPAERPHANPGIMRETVTPPGTAEEESAKNITKVSIVGGHNVKRSLVLSRLGIGPGDLFDADLVERGMERIIALPGVKSAFVRILPDRQAGGIELAIVISDAETRIARPAVSRAVTNDWSVGFRFEELNLRGVGEEVTADLLLGGATIARASFLKPWFIDQPYAGAGLSVSYTDYDYPYPDYDRLLYDKRIKRFEAAGEVRINLTDFLHLSLRPGIDIIDVADTMAIDERVPRQPSGTFTTFEAVVSIDFLDGDFYPSRGLEIAGGRKDWGVFREDSEIKDFRYWAAGRAYYKLWRVTGVLHSRAEFTKGASVPLLLRGHLGGEGTIRGYDFGALDGTNSVLAKAEIRLPLNFTSLYDPKNSLVLLDFHVFLDSGACWSPPASFDTELFHSGFGCGFNIIPARKAMLTFDYAWRMQTNGVWSLNAGFFF